MQRYWLLWGGGGTAAADAVVKLLADVLNKLLADIPKGVACQQCTGAAGPVFHVLLPRGGEGVQGVLAVATSGRRFGSTSAGRWARVPLHNPNDCSTDLLPLLSLLLAVSG